MHFYSYRLRPELKVMEGKQFQLVERLCLSTVVEWFVFGHITYSSCFLYFHCSAHMLNPLSESANGANLYLLMRRIYISFHGILRSYG